MGFVRLNESNFLFYFFFHIERLSAYYLMYIPYPVANGGFALPNGNCVHICDRTRLERTVPLVLYSPSTRNLEVQAVLDRPKIDIAVVRIKFGSKCTRRLL